MGHDLESIGKFVIEQLAAWEVPGCAIAAVHSGQVVLASGWGRRHLEADLPVTQDTLFAIGSTTKAFTAAAAGAHLREEFQYCNLGYMLAGYLVEVLSGVRWEEFLRSRLLTPLGMSRSNLSVESMAADPDHATPYDRHHDSVVQVPARPVTALAPAGAINSCAADMARWLLAQLGGGQLDGTTVIAPETLRRQHTPQMLIPEDRTFPAFTRHGYGLGWLIGRYRDHRLAQHGGGIDGYITECMLLPDDGIGVTVLTNASYGAVAPVVAFRVLDELLGLEPID